MQIGSHRRLGLSHVPVSLPRVSVSPRQPCTDPSLPWSPSSSYCLYDSEEEGRKRREREKRGRRWGGSKVYG